MMEIKKKKKKLRWHGSAVGRASDRHVADAGSIPGTASFFFFLSLSLPFCCCWFFCFVLFVFVFCC